MSGWFKNIFQKQNSKPTQNLKKKEKLSENTEKYGTGKSTKNPTYEKFSVESIKILQRWYRSYLNKQSERRSYIWKCWTEIIYRDELRLKELLDFENPIADSLKTSTNMGIMKFLTVNKQYYGVYKTAWKLNSIDDVELEFMEFTNGNNIRIEKKYNGMFLNNPISLPQLHSMITMFKQKKNLHVKYVISILHEARYQLKTLSNINHCSIANSSKITIIGDIYGHIDDLFLVFFMNGLPSDNNPYIINGNMVNRGDNSVMVLLTLLSSYLISPGAVFFNRGNYEEFDMSYRFGLVKEIRSLYPKHCDKVCRLIHEIFTLLPLATIIDNKIFVCHGGISKNMTLESIKNIKRQRYYSVTRMFINATDDGIYTLDEEDRKQIIGLLWNEPSYKPGMEQNRKRGYGERWGSDVTEAFLKNNNFNYIIRSNHYSQEGFTYSHNEKVLSFISCSNCFEFTSNKGAYVHVLNVNLRPNINQYIASPCNSKRRLTVTSRINLNVSKIHFELKEIMQLHKSSLMKAFHAVDHEKNGHIGAAHWSKILSDVTGMDIPWRALINGLVTFHPVLKDRVVYKSCFDDVELACDLKLDTMTNKKQVKFIEKMLKHKIDLESIFQMIDQKLTGCLTKKEFSECCALVGMFSRLLLCKADIQSIMQQCDNNGYVDYVKFLRSFTVHNNTSYSGHRNHVHRRRVDQEVKNQEVKWTVNGCTARCGETTVGNTSSMAASELSSLKATDLYVECGLKHNKNKLVK